MASLLLSYEKFCHSDLGSYWSNATAGLLAILIVKSFSEMTMSPSSILFSKLRFSIINSNICPLIYTM